jgi:hypothetical protein
MDVKKEKGFNLRLIPNQLTKQMYSGNHAGIMI